MTASSRYVAVLQDRVGWKDPILLPVSDHLFICQSGDERVTRCECGHSFGDYRKNWKLQGAYSSCATPRRRCARSIPTAISPIREWMEIREFICPECGTLHEVEAAAPGYPIVHDFEPDLEGFYRDWLGQAAPALTGTVAEGAWHRSDIVMRRCASTGRIRLLCRLIAENRR